jgi:acyl-CoA thioesterase FadM
MHFTQRIYRAVANEPTHDGLARGELLVEADVRVVCVAARTLKPKRLPDFLVATLALERA